MCVHTLKNMNSSYRTLTTSAAVAADVAALDAAATVADAAAVATAACAAA